MTGRQGTEEKETEMEKEEKEKEEERAGRENETREHHGERDGATVRGRARATRAHTGKWETKGGTGEVGTISVPSGEKNNNRTRHGEKERDSRTKGDRATTWLRDMLVDGKSLVRKQTK